MGDYVPDLLEADPSLVDYVEVPFEQLVRRPGIVDELPVPVVLHCASLSLAGDLPPDPAIVAQIAYWIARTRTPWLGEHLAFVTMSGDAGASLGHPAFLPPAGAGGGPFDVAYTVSPQYSAEILDRIVGALDRWEARLATPLLIENGPVYFDMPGSEMGQAAFLAALCRRRPATRLLLDLAHLVCTAANTGEDATALLDTLPLEHVVEVHLSGADREGGRMWDDHAAPIPPVVFALLDRLLERVRPRAVTLEYNWDPAFPLDTLRADLGRVRRAVVEAVLGPAAC